MNELIKVETMTSLQIAEVTGKQHSHVLRDIRKMVDNINQSTSGLVGSEYHREDRTQYKYLSEETQDTILNFAFGEGKSQYEVTTSSYTDSKGEERKMYNLNKKACLLLASGYDVVLRSKIIDRWEELEVKERQKFQVPTTFAEALRLAAEQQERIEAQQKLIEVQKPKAEFYDEVVDSKDAIDMKAVAKVLNMGMGRTKLFEFLRNNKVLMQNNQPYQKYVDMGWFRLVESRYTKPNGDICINLKTVVFQKGVDAIRKLIKQKKEKEEKNDYGRKRN